MVRGGPIDTSRLDGSSDTLEDCQHAIVRDVGAAADHVAVGGEKRRRRPTAKVVACTDVRTTVGIDTNGHESIVDLRDDLGIGERRAIHLPARLAPARDH